jgi:hypothetical protein
MIMLRLTVLFKGGDVTTSLGLLSRRRCASSSSSMWLTPLQLTGSALAVALCFFIIVDAADCSVARWVCTHSGGFSLNGRLAHIASIELADQLCY